MKQFLLFFSLILLIATANAQQERMIAYCYLHITSADSGAYHYNGVHSVDSLWSNTYLTPCDTMFTWRSGTNGYIPSRMLLRSYDADQKLLNDTAYVWSNSAGYFKLGAACHYSYDADGMPLDNNNYGFNSQNVWVNTLHDFYRFNTDRTPAKFVELRQSPIGGNFDSSVCSQYFYQSPGLLSSTVSRNYSLSTGAFYGYTVYRYTYTATNQPDSSISPTAINTNYYDNAGMLLSKNLTLWDSSGWHLYDSTRYWYNSNSAKVSSMGFTRDTTLGLWKPSRRDTFMYDQAGMLVRQLGYFWNTTTTDWRTDSAYDYRFYYEAIPNGVISPEVNAQGVVVKGNPSATGAFEIANSGDIDTPYTLSDITGRQIASGAFASHSNAVLSVPVQGVYLLYTTTGSQAHYQKLVSGY